MSKAGGGSETFRAKAILKRLLFENASCSAVSKGSAWSGPVNVAVETAEWGLDAGEQWGCAACQAHSHAWITGKHPGSQDQASIEVGIQDQMLPGAKGIRLEASTCEGAAAGLEGSPAWWEAPESGRPISVSLLAR